MLNETKIVFLFACVQVIRMGYRQLTLEEEKMDESVWSNWEKFLFAMQDANEFVSTQTPIIAQDLEDTYQVGNMHTNIC